ncbi:MAG: dynamin family protein [Candidatus Contendobacter sp.]|nr:dynamin family protein [Candidatus Contendobacter sp.]
MSMTLVCELHEARDRILSLKKELEAAREHELPTYIPFLDEQIKSLDEALEQAHIPERYRAVVVGRFKVGKSAFVNKLAGQRLAGVDVNPETAAISVFRYDSQARAEVELISQEEWERLAADHAEDPKNDGVKRYDRFIRFNERPPRKDKEGKEIDREPFKLENLVQDWVEQGGKKYEIKAKDWETKEGQKQFLTAIKKFTTSQEPMHYLVNKLTIYAPIPILKDQIELIDTPGLDDTERFRVLLTEGLVKDVDAILFLTKSGDSYSQSDKEFIVRQLRYRQIKHLQIIVTKCDETYDNAVRDAKENDDEPPTYAEFFARELGRVKAETKATLDELLQSNQLTDDEGYYFIEQLDNVPIQLISTKYHDDGEIQKGGIQDVKEGLYQILSTSQRFERAKTILESRLDNILESLKKTFRERLSTLESEFDPQKVKDEIESIRAILSRKLDLFSEGSGESLDLLNRDQAAFFKILPVYLDNIGLLAKDVLNELEKDDLIKHWKTRRSGSWGYLTNLQAKVADRIFPNVEARLNDLQGHLKTFMESMGRSLKNLQEEMRLLEIEHQLSGLEPITMTSIQDPLFHSMRQKFENLGEQERNAIITKLDDFVTEKVLQRLSEARDKVTDVIGRGTTVKQSEQVSSFYGEIRSLLNQALRDHLKTRIEEFAAAIRVNAESVDPRIRKASEELIQQRLKAIESTLQVAADGQKEQVASYLDDMITIFSSFGRN